MQAAERRRNTIAPSPMDATAILFDLDGVLVDSVECIRQIWRGWAEPRSLDVEDVLRVSHGRRTADAVRLLEPEADVAAEIALLDAAEATRTAGLKPVPGAAELLAGLPPGTWGIVTSGRRQVAELRMRHTGLPRPDVLVVAEDVVNGKPDPEGFLLAAERLGVPPEQCVVVEDAPAGIEAAVAAGMRTVGVASTHDAAELGAADVVVPALAEIGVEVVHAPTVGVRTGAAGTLRLRFERSG